MTPWFVSPFKKSGYFYGKGDQKDTMVHVRPRYRFGFDQINKVYKVICIGDITEVEMDDEDDDHDIAEYRVCGVFTIASGGRHCSWKEKNVSENRRCMVKEDGVHLNGSIYWTDAPNSIVAFNVGSEEFVEFPIPQDFFVKDEMNDYDLIEVNGRIALIKRTRMDTIRLWQLVADDMKRGNSDSTSSHWIEETILFTSSPYSEKLMNERYDFVSISGSNLIILVPKDIEQERDEVLIYCYNWQMKSFQEFDITGILPMLTPESTYSIAGYMESLSSHV
ncbi:F-box/LRR-repeat protein At2g40920-like [Papaver somniferum]|uniref:F-box/LRR-repeat protein At2g40920-like n=1 Tax=Papaver somniferum TaxID=3469 RepID=UPI000E6FD0F4|nr:F-box/LRR-repeat protein At2g40920-like [Papaver somniferum]